MCLNIFRNRKLKQRNVSDPINRSEKAGVGNKLWALKQLLYADKVGRKTDQGRAAFSLQSDAK